MINLSNMQEIIIKFILRNSFSVNLWRTLPILQIPTHENPKFSPTSSHPRFLFLSVHIQFKYSTLIYCRFLWCLLLPVTFFWIFFNPAKEKNESKTKPRCERDFAACEKKAFFLKTIAYGKLRWYLTMPCLFLFSLSFYFSAGRLRHCPLPVALIQFGTSRKRKSLFATSLLLHFIVLSFFLSPCFFLLLSYPYLLHLSREITKSASTIFRSFLKHNNGGLDNKGFKHRKK